MNRDEIAQAMQDSAGNSWGNEAHFQRFAALVAAATRKACARVCEEHWRHSGNAMNCADAIRARGQGPMPLFDDWGKDWTK